MQEVRGSNPRSSTWRSSRFGGDHIHVWVGRSGCLAGWAELISVFLVHGCGLVCWPGSGRAGLACCVLGSGGVRGVVCGLVMAGR
jgi:hypothetical protein